MIISKKKFNELFYNYSVVLYSECGRNLSMRQKAKLKNAIEKLRKEYTLWNLLKQKAKKLFQKKKS